MLTLLDLVHRAPTPIPWQEGDNIPWHDPDFSARMLAEHLTQAHDRASRRTTIIDLQVAWIHDTVLTGKPSTILDLGCGPGLYTSRLAAQGHRCIGIDYSPASIAYARAQAPDIRYELADIRRADYAQAAGTEVDLVMILFGEFNVFSQTDMGNILDKVRGVLRPGGKLLLEPHRYGSIAAASPVSTEWFSSPRGLFDPQPHLVLMENHWDAAHAILTRRYYVVRAADGSVTRYAQSMQAYTDTGYVEFLEQHGFTEVTILSGLAADRLTPSEEFYAILATLPA